jgi:hypothetical protein
MEKRKLRSGSTLAGACIRPTLPSAIRAFGDQAAERQPIAAKAARS